MSKPYLCHRAVDRRKVTPKARRDALTLEYLAANYAAETKHDGCQAIVKLYPRGGVEVVSRTGEVYVAPLPAARVLAAQCAAEVDRWGGLVVFCEAWWPGKDQFPEISGEFRRHAESLRLQLVPFDAVSLAEFQAGHSPRTFEERRKSLPTLAPSQIVHPERFEPGTYDAQALANRYVKLGGYDGLVLKRLDGTWTQDKKSGDEVIKIKAEVSLDLLVVDVKTGTGEKTGRPVYTITVEYKGVRSDVGSGMPHDLASVPKVGDIVEVLCMEVNKDGHLREPRYKGIRFDKDQPDN